MKHTIYGSQENQFFKDNPLFTGELTLLRPTKEKYSTTQFQNGLKHGLEELWYDDGKKWRIANYQHGELHGPYKDYYSNGNIWETSNYNNHQIHGLREIRDIKGNIFYKANLNHGKLHGLLQEWEKDNILTIEGTYANGNWLNGYYYNTISPKAYRKPYKTLSLNFAVYL